VALAAPISTLIAEYKPRDTDTASSIRNLATGKPAALRNGGSLISDGPFWTGTVERSMSFDGVDDYADTPTALSTAGGFTVSAWVKLDRTDRAAAAISQSGTRVSNFKLGVGPGGKWQFSMPRTDADSTTADTAVGPAATGAVWTQVAGVYDQAHATIRLYVNGVAAGTAAHTTPWSTTNGGLQFGHAWASGAAIEPLDGAIGEIKVHQAALDARQASELVIDPVTARNDRCEIGRYLHAGGPAVRAVASQALAGTDYQRRDANYHTL
jgi:hypothetical protein